VSHHIPEVNADQNSLPQIHEAQKLAGALVTEAKTLEHQIARAEKEAAATPDISKDVSLVQESSLGSPHPSGEKEGGQGPTNHEAGIYGDMAASHYLPSMEMVSMAVQLLTDTTDNTVFGQMKKDMGREPGFYMNGESDAINAAKGLGGKGGIFTAHSNPLSTRADGVSDFFGSPLSGVKGQPESVPNLTAEKELVLSQKLASEKKLGFANEAHNVKSAELHQAQTMGMAPGLVHSLKNDPKFVDIEKAARKTAEADDSNLWGGTA